MRSQITALTCYIFVIAIMYAASLLLPAGGVVGEALSVSDPAQTVLDLIESSLEMISTLALAVFGAATALVVKGREWSRHWDLIDTFGTILIFALAAMSTYCIYVTYFALISVVAKGVLDPIESRLSSAIAVAYYCLLCAIALLGGIFVRMMTLRLSDAK